MSVESLSIMAAGLVTLREAAAAAAAHGHGMAMAFGVLPYLFIIREQLGR